MKGFPLLCLMSGGYTEKGWFRHLKIVGAPSVGDFGQLYFFCLRFVGQNDVPIWPRCSIQNICSQKHSPWQLSADIRPRRIFFASSSICGIRQRAGFAGARGPGTETKRCTQRSQSNLWRRICDSGAFEPLEHTMFKGVSRLFLGFSMVFGIFTMCCASFSVFPGWLIYSMSTSFSHFRRCSMDVQKKFSGQPHTWRSPGTYWLIS